MKEKKAQVIAKEIISNYLGEAWNDLENGSYKKYRPYEKEMSKFYIHLYAQRASRMMGVPYQPH